MPSVAAMKFRRVVHMLAFFVKFSKAARRASPHFGAKFRYLKWLGSSETLLSIFVCMAA